MSKENDKNPKFSIVEPSANNLKSILFDEALRISELAKSSGLSWKTIKDIEECRKQGSPKTRSKILRALNKNPDKTKQWSLKEVFPND